MLDIRRNPKSGYIFQIFTMISFAQYVKLFIER